MSRSPNAARLAETIHTLFGPEATLFCGGAHFCPEFLTWERQIALDAVFSHVISPPFLVWRICGAIAERAPPHIPLTAQKLPLKSPTMRAHPRLAVSGDPKLGWTTDAAPRGVQRGVLPETSLVGENQRPVFLLGFFLRLG